MSSRATAFSQSARQEDFTASGGIINFKLKDARVRIEIDPGAAERVKLRISSKLLSLAEIARR
jgi:hypothetical protein